MKHKLRSFILRHINDTPFEAVIRNLYGRFATAKSSHYDRQTYEVMRRVLRADSNCIEVGSYRGELLKQMIRLASRGQHFAFEPVPENYRYLERTFKSAEVFNVALSDHTGTATFHHVVGRAARSGLKRVDYPDKNQEIQEITVQLDTLDRIMPRSVPIHFIKIDVEGAELQVLRGGRRLIKKNHPIIVFEHELTMGRHYGTTPEQVYDFLTKELAMKVSFLEDYLANRESLKRERFIEHVRQNSEFYFIAYPSPSKAGKRNDI